MTSWTTLSDADLTAGKPGTQAKFRALRDNPIAMGEAAAGAPGFVGATGASLVLLSSQTASASATIDFTSLLSSTYDDYEIHCINIVPATNATNLMLRMSVDNGTNWGAGASDYRYANQSYGDDGLGYSAFSSGTTNIGLGNTDGLSNTSSSGGYNGIIRIFGVNSTTQHKAVVTNGEMSGVTAVQTLSGAGRTNSATLRDAAVNALRLLMLSGNITSGTFRLYGIKKA